VIEVFIRAKELTVFGFSPEEIEEMCHLKPAKVLKGLLITTV